MSNKEQRKAPVLRFKGFTDDWEQHKLGELSIIQSGKTPSSHNLKNYYPSEIPWVRTGDLNNDLIISCEKYISKQGAKSLSFLPPNTVLIAMYGGFNQIGRTGLLTFSATINQALASILPNSITNSYFLLELLNKHKNDWRRIAASSRKDPNITKKDIENKNLFFTTKREQKQIENIIFHLSKLISLQQRKLDKLKEIKGFYLSKMFPVKEKIVPVLRFANFVDLSWKKQKLGDVGKAKTGIGFPNQEQGGKEGIPFYKVSDMNNPGNETTMISSNNYVSVEQIKRNGWNIIKDVPAIFFAKVGAAVLLNRKRICKVPFLLDNNTMAYCMNQSYLDPQFTKILFETINLPSLTQMGALPSYNASDIESFSVNIPSMTEQKRIAKLFYDVDNLIIDQKKKIKKLKQTKKFLLQNMFI